MLDLDTTDTPSRKPASLELLNETESAETAETTGEVIPLAQPETQADEKKETATAVTDEPKSRRKKKGSIKYKSHAKRDEVASYFEQIVAGLGKGTIRFESGKKEIVVSPGASCEIEIKARRKGRKERVRFEISWRTDEKGG